MHKLFIKKYPNLFHKYKNKSICFYNIPTLFCFRKKKFIDKLNPWVLGASFNGTMIDDDDDVVQEKVYKRVLSANNFYVEKALSITKNIDVDKNFVVYALPQFFEHDLLTSEQATDYIDITVGAISKLCKKNGLSLIISLHPMMSKDRYDYLSVRYDVLIDPFPIYECIAYSKIFISSFSSTTKVY